MIFDFASVLPLMSLAVLLFLHRAFFAQALVENPMDPLSGRLGPSAAAAYHSSVIVIQDTEHQFMKKPILCARIWQIWTFAFTAAVSSFLCVIPSQL